MKAPQLKRTSDYSRFKFDAGNRQLRNVKKLIRSMKTVGYIESHPIGVIRDGDAFIIKDGQHRFEAAKTLGIPFTYIEDPKLAEVSIADLNSATAGAWNLRDYVESYCQQGISDYVTLRRYVDEVKLPLSVAVSLLSGEQGGSGNAGDLVKRGAFKVRDLNYAYTVANVLNSLPPILSWTRNVRFADAVSKCVRVKEFDPDFFTKKARAHAALLQLQPTTDAFLGMIEEVYNRHSRKAIPLKFLANQAAKERNATKSGNGK